MRESATQISVHITLIRQIITCQQTGYSRNFFRRKFPNQTAFFLVKIHGRTLCHICLYSFIKWLKMYKKTRHLEIKISSNWDSISKVSIIGTHFSIFDKKREILMVRIISLTFNLFSPMEIGAKMHLFNLNWIRISVFWYTMELNWKRISLARLHLFVQWCQTSRVPITKVIIIQDAAALRGLYYARTWPIVAFVTWGASELRKTYYSLNSMVYVYT